MSETFYAGHEFEWIRKFLDAIPKKQRLKLSIAHSLATCIHHQLIYTKQHTFKLSHKTLHLFGLNRRCLEPYLSLFQQAGLIEYTINSGSSPTIKILALPNPICAINNKTIKQYIIKGTGAHQCTGDQHQCTGDLHNNEQVTTKGSTAKEGTYPPSKGGSQ